MKVLKRAGRYLKIRFQIYWGIGIFCSILCILLFLRSFPQLPIYVNLGRYEFAAGSWFMLLFIWAVLSRKNYRTFKKGFDGEQKVSDYIESKLSDNYYLINDVKRLDGYGNIDHIILAPNGIFVLETKNNEGEIFFNGDNWGHGRSPVFQAKSNAYFVYDIVSSSQILNRTPDWVLGIVVFPNAKIMRTKQSENPILSLNEVPDFLLNFRENEERYSLEEIEEIGKVILSSSNQAELFEKNFPQSLIEIIKEYI